jgi:exodeoxyribonuclease VII large subunit
MADDLFAAEKPAQPRIFSVTEVTRAVRGVIESAFDEVWVQGEVSNHRQQASGHQYFTLKDADCQLPCVMFARGRASRMMVPLRDGMLVQAHGRLTVYEARGQYQLNVNVVQAAGAGLLQAQFEALKRKLAAEGLFDVERKRALPKFPAAIGIVTSPTGAALRDMLNVLARRAPWLRVMISAARVQGAGAAAEIVAAIALLEAQAVDVIVVARGGGSIEDLWEFNDERLARAIAAARVPIVSAVGHEIDFTIADFAADVRAPTPSAAAELVAPDTAELLRGLDQRGAVMRRHVRGAAESARTHLAGLTRTALFREPRQRIEQAAQRVDGAERALARALDQRIAELRHAVAVASAGLERHRPDQRAAILRERLATMSAMAESRLARRIAALHERLSRAGEKLRLLSPRHTLDRGYTLTMNAAGLLLRSSSAAGEGTRLVTEFRDGKVTSVVRADTAPGEER